MRDEGERRAGGVSGRGEGNDAMIAKRAAIKLYVRNIFTVAMMCITMEHYDNRQNRPHKVDVRNKMDVRKGRGDRE